MVAGAQIEAVSGLEPRFAALDAQYAAWLTRSAVRTHWIESVALRIWMGRLVSRVRACGYLCERREKARTVGGLCARIAASANSHHPSDREMSLAAASSVDRLMYASIPDCSTRAKSCSSTLRRRAEDWNDISSSVFSIEPNCVRAVEMFRWNSASRMLGPEVSTLDGLKSASTYQGVAAYVLYWWQGNVLGWSRAIERADKVELGGEDRAIPIEKHVRGRPACIVNASLGEVEIIEYA